MFEEFRTAAGIAKWLTIDCVPKVEDNSTLCIRYIHPGLNVTFESTRARHENGVR